MVKQKNTQLSICRKTERKGSGLVNTLINKLPIELHLPGFKYCGPGTKLYERLRKGHTGVNPLDEACKNHDIAYLNNQSLEDRHKADWILENRAWERVKSKDANLKEKAAAWLVTTAMKTKRKLGMGLRKRKTSIKRGGALKSKKKHRSVKKQRIIPIPKKGGFLPLVLPLLAALGAVGGGAAGIAKAVNDAKANRQQLEEQKRHDKAMELMTKGKGLYLAPYKRGYGLYPWLNKKNYQ